MRDLSDDVCGGHQLERAVEAMEYGQRHTAHGQAGPDNIVVRPDKVEVLLHTRDVGVGEAGSICETRLRK